MNHLDEKREPQKQEIELILKKNLFFLFRIGLIEKKGKFCWC